MSSLVYLLPFYSDDIRVFALLIQKGLKTAKTMFTIKELAERWNIKERRLWDRIDRLRDILEPHIKYGENNRIEITDNAYKILEKLIEYEKLGENLEKAVGKVRIDLKTASEIAGDGRKVEETGYWRGIAEERGRIIAKLEIQLQEKEQKIAELQRRIEELQGKVAIVEYKVQKRWWQFWK